MNTRYGKSFSPTAGDASGVPSLDIQLEPAEFPANISWAENTWYSNGSVGSVRVCICDTSGNNEIELFSATWGHGYYTVNAGVKILNATQLKGKALALKIQCANAESLYSSLTVSGDITALYAITWMNGSENKGTDHVYRGTTPSYSGSTPAKASTTQYAYSFSGWSPTVVPAYANATYYAQFNAIPISYPITWKDYDGSTIATEQVAYGTAPSRTGPTRASTAEYSYAFAGWSPTPAAVTGAATYTATYTATKRSYTITWLDDDSTLIATESVEYGVTPSRAGPTKAGYTFSGWSPTPSAVTGDATYTATYTETSVHKTVKYYNGSAWVECYMQYYTGSEWVEVEPYYYDGSSWVLCSQS